MEAEPGLMLPQAKGASGCWESPEAGRDQERISQKEFLGSVVLPTPANFWPPELEEVTFLLCYFKPPSLWRFVIAASEN